MRSGFVTANILQTHFEDVLSKLSHAQRVNRWRRYDGLHVDKRWQRRRKRLY
jgi:hypothetical protein